MTQKPLSNEKLLKSFGCASIADRISANHKPS